MASPSAQPISRFLLTLLAVLMRPSLQMRPSCKVATFCYTFCSQSSAVLCNYARFSLFSCVFRLFCYDLRQLVTHFFLLYSTSAALGHAGLEAHGRAGLRRCRVALTLTGLGELEDRKCSFSDAI